MTLNDKGNQYTGKKILVIGNICQDLLVYLDKWLVKNTKTRCYDWESYVGGPAATAAIVNANYGDEVTFVGAVGNDAKGMFCKDNFKTFGVDTDNIMEIPNYNTPLGFGVIVKRYRTFIGVRDKMDKMGPPNLGDVTITGNFDAILTDGQFHDVTRQLIQAHPEAISIIDAGRATPEIKALCSDIDYVIGSEEFAQDVTGLKVNVNDQKSVINAYKKLSSDLKLTQKNNLVITLGKAGCCYNQDHFMPALEVDKVIDTTGAGDIFHGAFANAAMANRELLAYNLQDGLEQTLRFATIVASLSTESRGGIPAIPELNYVKQLFNTGGYVKVPRKNI